MNDQFLQGLSVRPSKDTAHNLVSTNPTGAYLAGHDVYDALMDWYSNNARDGVFMSLAQRPQEYSQVRVDIDIKVEGDEPRRLYTEEQLMAIIEAFQETLRVQVAGCTPKDLTVFILEKEPYIKQDGPKNFIKNGFHLHFPYMFLNRQEVHRNLYPRVGEYLDQTAVDFGGIVKKNPSELLDAHAGCFNHWLMYGSSKNSSTGTYRLSQIVSYEKVTVTLENFLSDYQLYDSNDSLIDTSTQPAEWWLPRILSINTDGRATKEITNSLLEVIDNVQNTTVYHEDPDDEDVDPNVVEAELIDAEHLLTLLSPTRADEHTDWWKICQILKRISHGNPRGFELFCQFTQLSERRWNKHGYNGCMDMWKNRKTYNFSMGTLKYLAKNDSPEGYRDFLQIKSLERLQATTTTTHNDFARILKDLAGDYFVFSDQKWWQYTGQRWKVIESGFPLKRMISNELRDHYRESLAGVQSAANSVESSKLQEAEWKEKRQYLNKLKDNGYKTAVMNEAKEVFWQDDFASRLDKNGKLFVFNNGVMDYNMTGDDGLQGVFRSLSPEDLTTKMANVPYIDYDDDSPEMRELMEYLHQVFPNEEVREFFLELYSDIMVAGNTHKIVPFWVGIGNNSKSVLQTIFENSLGEYFRKVPTSLFVGKRGQSGSANPEIARLEGARMGMSQETSAKEEINSGIFKELSGNDTMFCRGLYSEGREVAMEAIIGISCNNPPMLQGDAAAWNRVKVIDFEATFTDFAPANREEQFAQKTFPMVSDFTATARRLCGPLLCLLAKYKRKMMAGTLRVPKQVDRATQEYKKRNDIFSNYIQAYLVKDPQGTLNLSERYRDFKDWFKDMHSGSVAPLQDDFTRNLCAFLRVQIPSGNILRGIRQKTNTDQEIEEAAVAAEDMGYVAAATATPSAAATQSDTSTPSAATPSAAAQTETTVDIL